MTVPLASSPVQPAQKKNPTFLCFLNLLFVFCLPSFAIAAGLQLQIAGGHDRIEILIRTTIVFSLSFKSHLWRTCFIPIIWARLPPKKDGAVAWRMAANGELLCCKRSVAKRWPAATSIWAEEERSEEPAPPRPSWRWRREYHSLLVSCKGNYCWLKLLNICLLAPQSTL